jgi:hypothetical protein
MRNIRRWIAEGSDLHEKIRIELYSCFERTRNQDDEEILNVKNTILPGITELTDDLKNCCKNLLKELNQAQFDTEWADSVINQFNSIVKSVSDFKIKLTRVVSENQLDRKTEVNKLMSEYKVEKFDGWEQGQIIYDYLKQAELYFAMAGMTKDSDKAMILYREKLTKHVQTQMYEYRESYTNLEIIRRSEKDFKDPNGES